MHENNQEKVLIEIRELLKTISNQLHTLTLVTQYAGDRAQGFGSQMGGIRVPYTTGECTVVYGSTILKSG